MTTDTDDNQETKDLDYFLANPSEMPDDPTSIEGIEDSGEPPVGEPADTTTPTVDLRPQALEETPAPEPEPVAVTPEPAKPADPVEEKLPVETKDGKATIPYGVLAGEREKAREALAEAERLRQELAEANARPAAEPEPVTPDPEVEEPDWEKMSGEYPEEVVNALKSSWQTAHAARADAQAARQEAERFKTAEESSVREDSQQAIDRNPTLVNWQANHPEAWEQARQVDNMLMGQEEWATKTLDERFAKMVEMVVAMNPNAPVVASAPAEPTSAQTDAAAAAALAKAGSTAPTSLSDVPGGIPPPQSTQEALENTSYTQLERNLLDMDPDKMEEYLSRQNV
jgi:hypothetical protein